MADDFPQNDMPEAARHYQNGWTLLSQGRLVEAGSAFEQSLALGPDHPGALLGLGIVRFNLGKTGEGIVLLKRAHERAHGDAAIAATLGEFLCRTGEFGEAAAVLWPVAGMNPNDAAVHFNLGNALSGLNRLDEALGYFRRACELNPRLREAHNNAGLMLAAMGRHEEAVASYRGALACDADYLDARINLGISLEATNRPKDALAAFDAALAVQPQNAAALAGRGTVLRRTGRVDEARDAFEKAVALEPDNPLHHRALADAKTFGEGDPQIAQMEAVLRRALPREGRINLHFALGKAYDETGRYADAFANFEKGNKLWRSMTAYDEAAEIASLEAVANAFPPGLFETLQGAGHPSELPVFVFGMPRSGTTLVEQILASHPQVFGAGEIGDIGVIAAGGYLPANRTAFSLAPEALRDTGARYAEKLRARAPEAARIVDKQINNFIYAGLIHLALPGARLVHVRRDPFDCCLSCYSRMLTARIPYNSDLGELGRFYRAYETLMAHWRRVLPPGAMLEIDYEDIVGDLPAQARRLVRFCGLDWDECCLQFHTVERPVNTASAYQVRRPVYAHSVGRWRHYAEWLGPLFEALGRPES